MSLKAACALSFSNLSLSSCFWLSAIMLSMYAAMSCHECNKQRGFEQADEALACSYSMLSAKERTRG
jgi:hypothetical protein